MTRRLWNNPDISLIGRRTLLEQQIKPRIDNPSLKFLLTGEREVGKTALLEAAFDLCRTAKSFVHAGKPHGEICKQIVKDWNLDVDSEKSKPSILEMEKAILSCSGNALFIDDLHRSSAVKKIDFFKALADRHKLCGSILKGTAKENLKPLLAKMGSEIKIPKLDREDTLKLAERVCIHFASKLSYVDVANAATGLPGKIVTAAKSNEIQKSEIRSRSEEIDLSPLFLIAGACLVLFRYIGRVTDATDFVLLGGFGMVGLIFMRGIWMQGKER